MGTAEIYSKTMKVFREYMGNLRLTDVNHRHVDQFTVLRLEKVSPVTVNMDSEKPCHAVYTGKGSLDLGVSVWAHFT